MIRLDAITDPIDINLHKVWEMVRSQPRCHPQGCKIWTRLGTWTKTIQCVSWARQRMPQLTMISGCVLWGCLLAFGSVVWAKITLINVGGHQAICWGPEQNKKSEEGWIFCLVAFFSCPRIWDVSAPGSQPLDSDQEIHHRCLDSQAFGFRLNYTSGFPACRWQRDCVTSCLP